METCRTKNTVSSMQQARIWGNSREEGSEKLRRMILKVLNDAYATELIQEPLYSDTNEVRIFFHYGNLAFMKLYYFILDDN